MLEKVVREGLSEVVTSEPWPPQPAGSSHAKSEKTTFQAEGRGGVRPCAERDKQGKREDRGELVEQPVQSGRCGRRQCSPRCEGSMGSDWKHHVLLQGEHLPPSVSIREATIREGEKGSVIHKREGDSDQSQCNPLRRKKPLLGSEAWPG